MFYFHSFQDAIIYWNNKFPLDRWFREKYKIPFNSKNHRSSNPIDIFFEWKEDKMKEYQDKMFDQLKIDLENVKKGNLLKDRENKEAEDLFDNLDVSLFNKKSE